MPVRPLLLFLIGTALSAQVKDLSRALNPGLAKVYGGSAFRERVQIKALAVELQVMEEESNKDKIVLTNKYADSAGNWIPATRVKGEAALDAIQKTHLPLTTKIPLRITLSEAHIDSLHLTLSEDLALTPFVQIVVDTTKVK